MRRLYLLLLTLVVTLSTMANPIDRQQARQQAEKFLQAKGVALGGEAARAVGRTSSTSKQPLYVFNASNNRGFVIVAGDDRVEPIVGYTTRGSFDDGDLPENFRAWLEGYAAQLKAIEANEAKPARNKAARIPKAAIDPLIRTHWNQGLPYNLRTPTYKNKDGEYRHYVTGCVATALAQVMYYYQWPTSCPAIPAYTFQGEKYSMPELPATTFQWDKMKLEYNYDDSGEAVDAVAELMLYVGQANEMNYNVGGSAAYIHKKVMAETFGYSRNMYSADRGDYTTAEWEDLIYQELAANRPVLYDGQSDESGHQFICDGYDGDGFFHINWGWGGNSDGYFVLSLANPSEKGIGGGEGTSGYAYGQSAVIGFEPGSSDEPEIPHINFITRDFTPTTYSRTSSDVDFEDINAKRCYFWVSYNCDPTTTYPIEAGWALWQDGQLLNVLATQEITIDNREAPHSYYGPETFSFGAGLADGSYRIVFVWRPQGGSDWTVASTKEALYAEISGNTLNIRGVNANPVTYAVNEVRYTGEMAQGTTNSVTVNLTNTCDATQQTVYYWMSDGGAWSIVGQGIGCVEPGQMGSVNLTFIQESPGTFDVRITSDADGENVMWTSTVTIYELIKTTIDGITYSYVAEKDYTNIVDADEGIISGNPLVIPATITVGGKTYNVKKIEDNVFYGKNPSSLTIEPGVEEIGSYNFWNANSLTEVIIPEGVKIIGSGAFQYCYGLRELTLPSTLTSIGSCAFYGNTNLTTLTSAMTEPIGITADVFTCSQWVDDTKVEYFSKAALYVPIGTKTAYQNAAVWKEFSPIHEGKLEKTTINGITYSYVASEDFADIVDADIEIISGNPLVIPATITAGDKTYKVKKIGDYVFYGKNPSSLTIEPGVEEIGCYNFWNANSLIEVIIPEGIKIIGSGAFRYCYGLRELTLPSTLTSIGDYAFDVCASLTTVISNMIQPCKINRNVFTNSHDKDEIFTQATLYVPVGAKAAYLQADGWKEFSPIYEGDLMETNINGISYKYITGESIATVISGDKEVLNGQELIIPATITVGDKSYQVKSIAANAFEQVPIKSLTIEPGLEEIGKYSFWNVNGLKEVIIPEGVKIIGSGAFQYCYGLREITLPSTLTDMGEYTFSGCSRLTNVKSYMAEPCNINRNVFVAGYDDDTFTTATLNIPAGTKQAYLNAEGWKEFGDNIAETLPAPGEEEEIDGDANGDGEVNVADIDYVIERIGASYETNKAADVNHDDLINVADVDYIIERIN